MACNTGLRDFVGLRTGRAGIATVVFPIRGAGVIIAIG
jgi:hypothetical protein